MPLYGPPLDTDKPFKLVGLLKAGPKVHPGKIALVSTKNCWTWRQLDKASDCCAAHRQALGIRKGDRVASLMPNRAMRWLIVPMLTALVATLLVPSAASADPSMECDGTSQVEIRECLDETLARADAAVDEAFSFALTSAAETDEATGRSSVVPALYASQSAWEAFRDSQCDYVGSTYGGGSGTGIAILACRITTARARTEELLDDLG